ncbi:acyl-CoA dehydrogenase family protein [Mycobacterium avium]|jgi:hypothetical protein
MPHSNAVAAETFSGAIVIRAARARSTAAASRRPVPSVGRHPLLVCQWIVDVSTELPLERWFRDLRVKRLGEGATEVQREIIARSLVR